MNKVTGEALPVSEALAITLGGVRADFRDGSWGTTLPVLDQRVHMERSAIEERMEDI